MKIAIIGSGASGLTAIKSCLDEGLKPYCFEKQSFIGGLWHYSPGERDGATVYRTTVINTSKEMMCYSDFLIPKEFPNFMHNTKIKEYFELYAERFSLKEHITFSTEVLSCAPAEGFAVNGKWKLTTRHVETQKTTTDYFDGVMVCIGHHAVPYFPLSDFPGIKDFKGKIIHSHTYRDQTGFENLRVAVIGIGNSGGDIAVELSRHAKQVYLSTRNGTWILNRMHKYGMPLDYAMTRKAVMGLRNFVPHSLVEVFAQNTVNARLDHEKYGLRPEYGVFSQHPMVNDDMANRIITGSIQIKTNIARFTENTAVFEDGTEEQLDAVVFATGYSIQYPFLEEGILKVDENDADLYKFVFPTTLAKNTLAVIGCIQPLGAVNPISEMQCRWVTRVFKGEVELPTRDEMQRDIHQKKFEMHKRYVKSRRHTVQVDYIDYMDELADLISVRPEVTKIFLKDPLLAAKVFFGPAAPYIYRLQGPGSWSGARDAVMSVDERVFCPLATRKVKPGKASGLKTLVIYALVVAAIAWLMGLI